MAQPLNGSGTAASLKGVGAGSGGGSGVGDGDASRADCVAMPLPLVGDSAAKRASWLSACSPKLRDAGLSRVCDAGARGGGRAEARLPAGTCAGRQPADSDSDSLGALSMTMF